MFSKGFRISNTLHFNTHPKLYIVLKFCIILCIVVQRAFVIMQNPNEDRVWKFMLQILALPLLLACEYVLFLVFSRKKFAQAIEVFAILLTQIGFSHLFIEMSLLVFSVGERHADEIFFQECLFLNSLMIVLSDSKVIKTCMVLYISIISTFRLTLFENKLYYIGWAMMALIFSLSMFLTLNKDKKTFPVKIINNQSRYAKLENSVEGVALIHKDKSILYMNGLFKGMFESSTDQDALDRVLKLRKFESYSVTAQKEYMQDNKVKFATTVTPRIKSSVDFNGRHLTDHPTSLGLPKAGSFAGSLLSPRPSIMNHRPSIRNSILGPPSIVLRRESNHHSIPSTKNLDYFTGPPKDMPVIKINMSRLRDTELRPGDYALESETRSPLVHLAPELSLGGGDVYGLSSTHRDARLSSRSNVPGTGTGYIDTYQHENIALGVDTNEKEIDKMDTVEATIDRMFTNLSLNTENRQRLVITQLIENMPFPLEILKGKPPSSPINTRRESLSLGNLSVEKAIVTLKDTKQGTKVFEMILSPFIYLQKETICLTVKDISYELKSQELGEILESKNKALKFVSHEFRSPLNCTIALLNVMKNLVPEKVCSKYLLPALNSSKMLLNLANDILDHAQIQAKKLKIHIIPCKVKRILEEVIEMMNIQACAKNIDLILDWDPKIPYIFYTDPNRLRQIMLNLVSNALKYTRSGRITLQGTYDSPTTCKLAVIDTGVGISQRGLSELFSEFVKIKENRNLNPRGVGLGLVISKLLSQELGLDSEGLIVESEEGKGSNFYFFLESKIDVLAEDGGGVGSDEGESLDEYSGVPFSVRTTNQDWEEIAPKMQSTPLKVRQKTLIPKPTIKLAKEKSVGTPRELRKQESGKANNFLNFPFSKTVENLESVPPTSKKKSSDIELHRQSLFPSSGSMLGKRNIHQRSFTLEDVGTVSPVNTDTEFSRFLRKVKHTCSAPQALLVDDSIFNLTALQALLSNTFGIESVAAMNGEDAITEVMKNERCCSKCKNFKVIFMDVEMPKLNGFDTTQILRKKMLDKEISFIPIIGVTGYDPSEKRVQCLTSGMNDMVAKPVSQQVIKNLLIRWIHPM